jgi:hypothetical protein
MSTQISLTLPDEIHTTSTKYAKDNGFRSVQEYILDSLRERIVHDRRARIIEERMKRGKGVKTFSQEEAKAFLRSL